MGLVSLIDLSLSWFPFMVKLSPRLRTYSPKGQGMDDRRLPENGLGDLRTPHDGSSGSSAPPTFVPTPPDHRGRRDSLACEMRYHGQRSFRGRTFRGRIRADQIPASNGRWSEGFWRLPLYRYGKSRVV